MPAILRDVGVNGIWEGSGNVMALDVLRAMAREPEGLPALPRRVRAGRGANARLDAHLDALPGTLAGLADDAQWQAPRASSRTSRSPSRRRCWCAPRRRAVADAFCAGRLGEARGRAFGTLPRGVDGAAVVARVLP